VGFCLIFLCMFWLGACHQSSVRCRATKQKLEVLADALLQYKAVKGRFPRVRTLDVYEKPMHSWRVLLVPYLETGRFYDEYDMFSAWNEGGNEKLLSDFYDTYEDGSSRNRTEVRNFYCFCRPDNANKFSTAITMLEPETDVKVGVKSANSREPKSVVLIAWKKCSIHWMNPADYKLEDIRAGTDCKVEEIEAIVLLGQFSNSYSLLESADAVEYARNNWIRRFEPMN
jgi:hypothetical protein